MSSIIHKENEILSSQKTVVDVAEEASKGIS
jgi:hypothetical protein